MYKNVFMALAMLLAISNVSYSQEEVSRSISAYICGSTGNINPSAEGPILGTAAEAGVSFGQNFANATWLSVGTTIAVCTETGGLLSSKDDYLGASNDSDNFSGYAQFDLGLTEYFTLSFNTTGQMIFDVNYGMSLPANQSISVVANFEINPAGSSFYATVANGGSTRNILNHMDYRLVYGVGFLPEWSFSTDLRFRFNGSSETEKADSLTAVTESFNIRWNNTISYENENGFGGYVQLSYRPSNLANDADVDHNLQLWGGVSYSYDM